MKMKMKMKITDKQIREYLLADDRNDKVRITRYGAVHVHTERERGDGGNRPWWMFAGYRADILSEMKHA